MNSTNFDALARRTGAAVSRRSSLVTLGGAALGAALAPALVEAGKAGKKAKKKCKKQVGKCKTVVEEFCSQFEGAGEAECLLAVLPCCDPLKTCKAGDSTECFIDVLFSDMM